MADEPNWKVATNTHEGGEESGGEKWRPYGDSNPGYRRERAVS